MDDSLGLLVIDVQEKLFPHVERACETLQKIDKVIQAFQIFSLPIVVTEQYPKGLGFTLGQLQDTLKDQYQPLTKTHFCGSKDPEIAKHLNSLPVTTWVLCGIEAHVCVLQTAKHLVSLGKKVIVVNDAISSRSIYDYSTAIAEMRDDGARITSTETLLFEMVEDAKAPEFKQIQGLIKD